MTQLFPIPDINGNQVPEISGKQGCDKKLPPKQPSEGNSSEAAFSLEVSASPQLVLRW